MGTGTLLSAAGATKSVGRVRSSAIVAAGQWSARPATRRVWRQLLGAIGIHGRRHARPRRAQDGRPRAWKGQGSPISAPTASEPLSENEDSKILDALMLHLKDKDNLPGNLKELLATRTTQSHRQESKLLHRLVKERTRARTGLSKVSGDGGLRAGLGTLLRKAPHPPSGSKGRRRSRSCRNQKLHGLRRSQMRFRRSRRQHRTVQALCQDAEDDEMVIHTAAGSAWKGAQEQALQQLMVTLGTIQKQQPRREGSRTPRKEPSRRGHGGLQSQPRAQTGGRKAAPWRCLNPSHKGPFRLIPTVLAVETLQLATFVSPMFAQLIGMSQALEVQLGPWPFLKLLADPRIEPEVDDGNVWDTACINESSVTPSYLQHDVWTGASGSMDSSATIEPSNTSCCGDMVVLAQGSLVGRALTATGIHVHSHDGVKCTVDKELQLCHDSEAFAQLEGCFPSAEAGLDDRAPVQPLFCCASSSEVLRDSSSGLGSCLAGYRQGNERRQKVSFGHKVAFWFPSASQIQLPAAPTFRGGSACSIARDAPSFQHGATCQVPQVRHVGLRLPACSQFSAANSTWPVLQVGLRPLGLEATSGHSRFLGPTSDVSSGPPAATPTPKAEHVGAGFSFEGCSRFFGERNFV